MMSTEQFDFLITTDNHMGFKQNDHIRRKDSHMAFAEALEIARERAVDFVLLGGDLFHSNRPSPGVEHKCIKIIRQHINAENLGENKFRRIKGELSHFERLKHANFEDPNLKVRCPIFTIHGNHDDPTGPEAKSVCEKLATCGLINYFGLARPDADRKIRIKPVVLQKGSIKIALYGLGFIPDWKLKLGFEKNAVHFESPDEDTFNILIVHQNRIPFDERKFIPDKMFPKFFHLIVRGHEHTTQAPEKIPDSEVDGIVYQPGSTVATSISTMESGPKKVGIMSVKIRDESGDMTTRYKLDYELVTLKCCRPMILKDISQKEVFKHIKSSDGRKKLTPEEYKSLFQQFVTDRIEQLLDTYESEFAERIGNERMSSQVAVDSVYSKLDRFKLPLMRIRLEYVKKAERFEEREMDSLFHPQRVANLNIVMFKKQKLREIVNGQTENVTFEDDDPVDPFDVWEDDEVEAIDLAAERRETIDVMIENYFTNKPDKDRLRALSIQEYTNAVRSAAEEGNVISKVLARKKMEILQSYRKVTEDNTVAETLNDLESVEEWMMKAVTGVISVDPFEEDEADVVHWED